MEVSQLNEAVLKAISEHLPAIQVEQLREQLNRIPEQAEQIEALETQLKEARVAADHWKTACTRLETDLARHGAIQDGEAALQRAKEAFADDKRQLDVKKAKFDGQAEAMERGLKMLEIIFQQVAVPQRAFYLSGSVPVAGQHGYPEQGNVSLSGTVDG